MTAPIEFFFDFTSPYSYFAAQRIESLAAKYGRTVAWRPFLLGVIFKESGTAPLTHQFAPKARYAWHDFKRSARYAGLPPFTTPEPFPISTHYAARAALWIDANAPEKTGEFIRAATLALFSEGQSIDRLELLQPIIEQVGLDGAALIQIIQEPESKEALRAVCDEARARGVFGAPFIFVDGEPFWGNDRLEHVQAWLERGGF